MATLSVASIPASRVLWQQLSPPVQASIMNSGMHDPALFRGLFDGSIAEACEVAREFGGRVQDWGVLRAIWVAAEDASHRSVTALALVPAAIATARATVASRKRGLIHSDFVAPRPRQHLEFGGALPPARHPSWPKPKLAAKPHGHDPNARAKSERDFRTKWLVGCGGLIVSAGLPSVTLMQGTVSADVLVSPAGQGRRARTFVGVFGTVVICRVSYFSPGVVCSPLVSGCLLTF